MSESKGFKEGRNNDTGRFVPVKVAREHPKTNSVEVIPKKGNGDTGRYDPPKKGK